MKMKFGKNIEIGVEVDKGSLEWIFTIALSILISLEIFDVIPNQVATNLFNLLWIIYLWIRLDRSDKRIDALESKRQSIVGDVIPAEK